jgi:hypothetical protein
VARLVLDGDFPESAGGAAAPLLRPHCPRNAGGYFIAKSKGRGYVLLSFSR